MTTTFRTYPVKGTRGILAVCKVDNHVSHMLFGEPALLWRVTHVPSDMGFLDYPTKREAVAFAQQLYAALPHTAWLEPDLAKLNKLTRSVVEKRNGKWEVKHGIGAH